MHDGAQVFEAGRHGDRAGAVLAGLQHSDCLPGMVGDAGDKVYGVELVRVDDLADIADAPLDAEALADALEPFFAQVADRHLLDVGVLEVDGDEFSSEPHAHYGDG